MIGFRVFEQVMPAAASILRQSRINATSICRQLMKHRSQSLLATERMNQEEEEYRPPRKIRFFSGKEREKQYGWIRAFCSLKGNDIFVPVDEEFIKDSFNLHGLSTQVLDYERSIAEILSRYSGSFDEDTRDLYGLIHKRFILSGKGLEAMNQKFQREEFQKCPRSCCEGQTCLPVGLSDAPNVETVKFFCPRCEELYDPVSEHHADVDGAFFGPTFPHLLLMTHPMKLKPCAKHRSTSGYVPRIFGFKVHKPATSATVPCCEETTAIL